MDDLPASPNDDNKSIRSTASISPLSFSLTGITPSNTPNILSSSSSKSVPPQSSSSSSTATSTVGLPQVGTNTDIPLPPLPTMSKVSVLPSSSTGYITNDNTEENMEPRLTTTTNTTTTISTTQSSSGMGNGERPLPSSSSSSSSSSLRSTKHGHTIPSTSVTSSTILAVPPSVQLPSVPLPITPTIDIRSGDHGWRNIPDILRDSIALLIDSNKQLIQNQNILLNTVGRRAGHTEVASALANKVNTTQLSALTRYIQTDILQKLDSPCSGHTTTNRQVSTVVTRLNTLESLVEAHDKAVVNTTKEMLQFKQNMEKHAYITIPMLDKKINQTVATLATVTMLDQSKQATIDEIKTYTETSLTQKADILTVKALLNDIHILTNAMETFEKTLQYPFATRIPPNENNQQSLDTFSSSSPASTLTNVFMQHLHETIQLHIQTANQSIQQQLSNLNKKLQYLYSEQTTHNTAGEGEGSGGNEENIYSTRSMLHKHTGTGGGPKNHGNLPMMNENNLNTMLQRNPLTVIVENTVKSKLANLNIAIDKQLHNHRHEYDTKLKEELETIHEDIGNALKTKLNKGDFTKAITSRPTVEMVQDLLKNEVQTIDNNLKKKADQIEVSALKRSIMNIENALLQYQIIKSTQELTNATINSNNNGKGLSENNSTNNFANITVDVQSTTAASTLAMADALSSLKGQITALASKTEAQNSALQTKQNQYENNQQSQRYEIEQTINNRIENMIQSSLQKLINPTIQEQIQQQIRANGPTVHPKEIEDVRNLVTQLYQRIDTLENTLKQTMNDVQSLVVNPSKNTYSSKNSQNSGKVGILNNQSDLSHVPVVSSVSGPITIPPKVGSSSISSSMTARWVWKNRRLVPYTGTLNSVLRFSSSSSSSLSASNVHDVNNTSVLSTTASTVEETFNPLSSTDYIRMGAVGLVAFDMQPIIPTNKDIFTWVGTPSSSSGTSSSFSGSVGPIREIDRTVITTTVPGLYQISLGFFALALPMLTVLVDNQPVLSTVLPETITETKNSTVSATSSSSIFSTQPTMDQDISNISADTETIMDNLMNNNNNPSSSSLSNEPMTMTTVKNISSLLTAVPIETGATVLGIPRNLLQSSSTTNRGGTASNPSNNSGGGQLIIHKHPAGSVAGITLNYYLALPAQARLSILYAGQTRGQGFMELTKL